MKFDNYKLENKFTKKFITHLREEDLEVLKKDFEQANKAFSVLEMYYCCAKTSEETESLSLVQKELEVHYKKKYEKDFFSIFRPWGSRNTLYNDAEYYTFFDIFFIRRWNGDRYVCLPIIDMKAGRSIISVKTPEEFYTEGEYNVPFYINSFLAMLGFYCDLVEYVQQKYGEATPKCDKTECDCNYGGKCVKERMVTPKPCLKENKGGEN